MRTIACLRFARQTFYALLLASLTTPAFAQSQLPGSASSTTTIGTGMVTPNQRHCPPDDPEPCDPIPTNKPPTITWAAYPSGGTMTLLPTDTVPLEVYASDPDGTIAKVTFILDSQGVATDTTSPYQTTLSHLAGGTHTVYAVAYDNMGRTTSSSAITLNVRVSAVKGNVDGVSSSGLITGWACSTWLPQSINVDLYLGGPAGTGVGNGRFLANKSSEAAVASACSVSSGSYRFQIQLTDAQRVAYGGRTIYIHGISPIGEANNLLGASGNFTVPVAVRDAQFSAQSLVTAMLPGETKNVTVQMHNNGNYIWTAAANFRLGSQNPASNATWGVSRVNATSDVSPGQTGTFNFSIRAPSTPGVYNFQWQMLQENVAWFGDLTPNMAIKVLSGSISASPTVCTIPTGSSTCTATLNWSSNSSTSEVWVAGLDGSSPQLFARNQSGSQAAAWINSQGSRFTLKSDGYVLDTVDVRGLSAPVVTEYSSVDYDELGRVLDRRDSAGRIKESFEYDGNGNVTQIKDALGHITTLHYDALDRVDSVTDAANHTTTYQHDVANRITKVIDPSGHATSYTYDGFGQLWQEVSPDTGTTTLAYGPDGLLTGMTRADGTQTTYDYDALYRRTGVSADGLIQHATYDACTNGAGRLCSVSDATGTTSYSYTPQGEAAGRGFSVGGTTYALGYGYDVAGRLSSVVYPDGNKVIYSYANGRVSEIVASVDGVTIPVASDVAYRPGDRLLSGWTSGNGLTTAMGYDGDGRLTGITVPGVQNLGFHYDDADRIDRITNGQNALLTQSFGYDPISRLSTVTSTLDNESFQYDANGNRLTQVVNGVTTTHVIDANSNRLASVDNHALGYGPNGNTFSVDGVPQYHYDKFNRLDSAGGMTYYVNPEGQRLRKAGGSGTYYFAPDRSGAMLAEFAGGEWIDYVWLNGRLVGRIGSGQIYAVHTDQVGRPEVVTNAAGATVWVAQNFAFTRNVVMSDVTLNLGFPGQYYDDETGLWNNGFRDYDGRTGRYIESDPLGLIAGTNTYAYVHNNPLSNVDPFGMQELLFRIGRIGGLLSEEPLVPRPLIEPKPGFPERPLPDNFPKLPKDGKTCPGKDWEWRGPDAPGGSRGGLV